VTVGRTVQVTRDPGLEVDPAISPDGALVAYAAGPPTRMQIFVRQVSGGRVIALTSDSSRNHRWPRWSPDGARIAYQTDDGIDVVPALGGQPQPIVRLEPPPGDWRTGGFARLSGFAWSPDGSRIAYANSFVEATLTIVRIDGGEPADLALARGDGEAAWAGIHSPAWSRDGSRLAVVSDNPIFVFGGVYFGNEGSSSIWIVPVNGEPPVRVTDDPYLNTSPQWAPDGRHLSWVSDRGGSRDVYRARVSRAGSLAGDPVRVTTGADAHTITLSPDGTRLAYASFRTHSNVWAVPLPSAAPISGDAARAVTSGVQTIESVDVTADGERLVFDSDRDGNFEIYTMPVGASEPTRLTTDPAGDYGPAWSPDGSHIAFHSLRHGTRDVFTMRADGSGLTRRTEGPSHQLDVDWSPDGGALVFEVLTWDLHLGHFSVLTLDSGQSHTLDVVGDFARWSPAGDLVAFHGPDGLRVISPSGGESRLIAPITEEYGEPFYSAWAPDGRTLYYLAKGDRGASIHAVSPAGGAARLLVRFDDPSRQPTRYGFTTDGRRFYLTMGSHESDVWVAELETR
jgi:TolB protein